MRRVLVATGHLRSPDRVVEHACTLAGPDGEVVVAAVLTVPLAQPIGASLDRSVSQACATLDAGERAASSAGAFDSRLVRARSFAEGVLELLAEEPFDMLVLETERAAGPDGAAKQTAMLLEKATPTVVLIRLPRPDRPPSS